MLATYPAPVNIAVVKEFYTNARRLGDHPDEDYLSYVRGHVIRYDPDSINRFLDTEWVGEQCQFALNMEEGADFEDVEKLAGVNISAPPYERPRKAIDEAYYRQYCGSDEAAQPVPPRCPRRGRGPPQGQVATAERIIGLYDTPPAHKWTMDEFHSVVAWPEEQAQGSRAGAAEASAMEDDDNEDAFEDVEDDEEEEDTNDNMG
ncbi:hypothetical protein LR48_Vigan404s000200 [Vigna angularis]|uniref:Putative plant transposon protein domain-containing protein n=1 Tax=Phaseolus angularis TaxID=3914 RepID=A0A0L9T9V8_PHAAN|nr:hypothetical protein LR48_Vigan404s000200 [Vigna angularis]